MSLFCSWSTVPMMVAMSPTNTLLVLALLAGCDKDDAGTSPDASAPASCGPTDDTENGGTLYSCTTSGGHKGLCTQDLHGAIQCFPTCTARNECDRGSSSYVLQLADNTRPCFCVPDQGGP